MAVDMSRFRSLDAVPASGHDRVVELQFTNIEGVSLYAHSCVLSNWSRVLANVIEDSHSTQPDAAAAAGPVRHQTIPLDDADCSAWEDALSLMYPAVPLFQVTWDNAARLLLLADKYDMPAVAEHVRLFLDTPREAFAPPAAAGAAAGAAAAAGPLRLEAQLTSGNSPGLPNVFEWLQVTSKCALEQHAQTCIHHIIQQQLQLPAGLISSVRPQHAEDLFNAMQQELQRAQALLQQAAVPSQAYRCACCGNRWYQLPGSGHLLPLRPLSEERQAAACVHCGEYVKQLHHGEWAPLAAGLVVGDADAGVPPFSGDGTTDDGSDEGDTDDDEGEDDESDEAMSQDSNSQDADEELDGDIPINGGSEDDDMAGSSDDSDDEEESDSDDDTDDSSIDDSEEEETE